MEGLMLLPKARHKTPSPKPSNRALVGRFPPSKRIAAVTLNLALLVASPDNLSYMARLPVFVADHTYALEMVCVRTYCEICAMSWHRRSQFVVRISRPEKVGAVVMVRRREQS